MAASPKVRSGKTLPVGFGESASPASVPPANLRSQSSSHDLLVVARTEALIADLGLDEALKRAQA
jgi:hypothetical protein